ncbi:hypothetical protein JNJ66_07435 [Candidatus Saccharibacteria bacterium]|nr:hypothetical protein [Candidatus Saccharibacteria bacterium]
MQRRTIDGYYGPEYGEQCTVLSFYGMSYILLIVILAAAVFIKIKDIMKSKKRKSLRRKEKPLLPGGKLAEVGLFSLVAVAYTSLLALLLVRTLMYAPRSDADMWWTVANWGIILMPLMYYMLAVLLSTGVYHTSRMLVVSLGYTLAGVVVQIVMLWFVAMEETRSLTRGSGSLLQNVEAVYVTAVVVALMLGGYIWLMRKEGKW